MHVIARLAQPLHEQAVHGIIRFIDRNSGHCVEVPLPAG
jgi:hypothetical protein